MTDMSALWRYGEGEATDEEYRLAMQASIDSGQCWMMEGSMGRAAMEMLKMGACVLPEVRHKDYWGSTVPSRNDVEPGSAGSVQLHEQWKLEHDHIEPDEEDDDE